MFGPGAYRPDPTEGITAIADLPPPEIVPSSRTYTRQACPRCGHQAYRDKQYQRTLHDLGNLDVWCPRSRGHLFAALLYEVSQVLSRGPLRPRTTR
jgi:hypothetical protein